MSYQYLHVDNYGLVGSIQKTTKITKSGHKVVTTKQKMNLREILEEQARVEEACRHVKNPQPPQLLFGVPPLEALSIGEEWAETAVDARGHKIRKDGNVAVVGVISLPAEMSEQFDDFAVDCLVWLKQKYGDCLKSVISHKDEAHPHLHFTVIPKVGERYETVHEGVKAKNESKNAGQKAGDQNLAFIGAMRELQDDFSEKVASKIGLVRLGPGRRRLTRSAWQAEKAQGKYFANAKKLAFSGYKAGLKKAEKEASKIIADATAEASSYGEKIGTAFKSLLGNLHKPTASVLEELEQEKKKLEAQKLAIEKLKIEEKRKADNRVAVVSTSLTIEKEKSKDLDKELSEEVEKNKDLGVVVSWYERTFGKAPEDLIKPK